MSSRELVLERIRLALSQGTPHAADDGRVLASASAESQRHRTVAPDLDLFCERVRDYKAEVVRVPAAGVAGALRDLFAGIQSVVLPPGVPAEYLTALPPELEIRHDEPPLSHAQLDVTAAVLTTCAVAISVSGTVILDAAAGQGRRALSLLPDFHVVVVRAEQVVDEVAQALARLEPNRPQTWISGPSATSDIELSRVEGVHGPRRLAVVVVDAADGTPPS